MTITFEPIGTVRSPFAETSQIPKGPGAQHTDEGVLEIRPDCLRIQAPEGEATIKADFVFALTGYHPDFDFLRSLGVKIKADDCRRPECDPQTLESNVPGIYLAGVVIAGSRTSEIFIENGRFHGKQIAADLKLKLRP